jgi:hypothetical protein
MSPELTGYTGRIQSIPGKTDLNRFESGNVTRSGLKRSLLSCLTPITDPSNGAVAAPDMQTHKHCSRYPDRTPDGMPPYRPSPALHLHPALLIGRTVNV